MFSKDTTDPWRPAFSLSLVAAFTGFIATPVFYFRAPILVSNSLGLATVALAGILILLATRSRKSELFPNLVTVSVVLAVLIVVWRNHDAYVASKRAFSLFIGYKILAIAIGLFPPRRWVASFAFIATAATTLGRFYTWPLDVQSAQSIQEPWITLIFVALGATFYSFRLKGLELEQRTARLEAQALLLQRFAHLLINAQHLANTPLQTMSNTTKFLKGTQPQTKEEIEVMERSIASIREVVALFSKFETYVVWDNHETPYTIDEFRQQADDLFKTTRIQ